MPINVRELIVIKMKVVLFASGVLAAVGEALSLAQSVHRETADLTMDGFDPLTLVQTSQA